MSKNKSVNGYVTELQKNAAQTFSTLKWEKPDITNGCQGSQTTNSVLILSNTQKFVREYLEPSNPNGIFLWHSVGSGKTLSAVSILEKFEDKGYNTLWVTRTTLKDDLDKALKMLPLKKKLLRLSYKQFSNVAKRKGENYQKLLKKALKLKLSQDPRSSVTSPRSSVTSPRSSVTSPRSSVTSPRVSEPKSDIDPLYKTILVIDEAHKLYTKDLKPQEMHDISVIEKLIHESYAKSGKDSVKVVLMSATPITSDPEEILKLFNLIIENPANRIDIEEFKKSYVDELGNFTKTGLALFREHIKDIVSYIDLSKDPRKFAQVKYNEVLVPISTPEYSTNFDREPCDNKYDKCRDDGKNAKECRQIRSDCLKIIRDIKKDYIKGKYQSKMLDTRCKIDVNSLT